MDSGLAASRAPRNDELPHPTLTTATASSDSIVTVVTSCTEVFGCARHCASFSPNERLASKKCGS
jgi:hypothetical protein